MQLSFGPNLQSFCSIMRFLIFLSTVSNMSTFLNKPNFLNCSYLGAVSQFHQCKSAKCNVCDQTSITKGDVSLVFTVVNYGNFKAFSRHNLSFETQSTHFSAKPSTEHSTPKLLSCNIHFDSSSKQVFCSNSDRRRSSTTNVTCKAA